MQTVLLGDIFGVVRNSFSPPPSQIVLKIDIEQFECRAFLGSPEVLNQSQDIHVLAVIMEWVFLKEDGNYSEQCPKEKVIKLAKLFLENGYTPFRVWDHISAATGLPRVSKLDASELGVEWKCNVAWLSNTIVNDVSNVINVLAFDSI